MTINWTFYNTPRGQEYFKVSLSPSIPDHIFSFNLAVHREGDNSWIILPNFVPGNEAHSLFIRGTFGHDLMLIIRDKNNTEKRLRYSSAAFWVPDGDLATLSLLPEYQKYFTESLNMTEEEMACEALYDEYKKLEGKTHMEAQVLTRGQPYKVHVINPQDLMLRKAVAKELVNTCKFYFEGKPAEWYELKKEIS